MKRGNYFIDFESTPQVELPFKMEISFAPIITYYEKLRASDHPVKKAIAESLLEKIDATPRLRQSFHSYEEVWEYEQQIYELFDIFFAEMLTTNEIKAAVMPFNAFFFRASARMRNIVESAGDDLPFLPRQFDSGQIYILAATFALNVIYGAGLNTSFPLYYDIPDSKTNTVRHYRAFNNADFSSIRVNGKDLGLTEEDFRILSENYQDLELWKSKIPPHSFIYEGFGLLTLVDLTMDESVSSLKNILLKKNALFHNDSIDELEGLLRNYFGDNSLELGLAQYHKERGEISLLRENITKCIFLDGDDCMEMDERFCDNSFSTLFVNKQPAVFSNIELLKDIPSPVVRHYSEIGIKSAIILPLTYDEKIIGFLELTSTKKNAINNMFAYKMQDVLPLFTIALQRAIDEQQTRVEAYVQEKFTSLHPTVAWKFFEVAERELSLKNAGKEEEEEISFNDVYPLYGQFDIRSSSSTRNAAVQNDLTRQLTLAEEVFKLAREENPMPIYQALSYRIKKLKNSLKKGMHAGDEVTILDFLKSDIYPAFNHIASESPALSNAVEDYKKALNPELNVVYEERKDYENTVTLINDTLGSFIDIQQEQAQKMIPHYFEKYKTDGVEYNIYLGKSLLRERSFDPIHVQNLRLWQLLMTIAAERKLKSIQDEMPVRLEVSSLILVHSSPLAIKFRMDEKKFDVDGAYNIRYEIIKKRIDKAYIKGTQERLTQPGKIAIVYTQDWEAEEYSQYLDYLHHEGFLEKDIEFLDLEDLQGTNGLKAIRVGIDFNSKRKSASLQKQLQEITTGIAEN